MRPNNGAALATASPPSVASLTLAACAMAASLILMLTGRSNIANFLGQWAPAILMMGVYNKITPRAPPVR